MTRKKKPDPASPALAPKPALKLAPKLAQKAAPELTPKAAALLDAHVAFWLDRLDGKALEPWLAGEVDALLADAAKLKLKDAVRVADVQAVARQYAAEIEPHGAIPELVGEIAAALQAHPLHAKTRLAELLPDRHFREWLDKLLELKSAREALLHAALANPVVHSVAGDLLYRGISGYLAENSLTKSIPGASSMLKLGKSVLSRATPRLDAAIETTLRKYLQQSLDATLRESEHSLKALLTDAALREAALDVWAGLKQQTVSQARATVTSTDLEELFVIGYEHWRTLRKSPWYGAMIDAGVEAFFAKYGDASLAELLDEMGVTRAMILADASRFALPALAALKKKKLLEPLVRRQLEPFYASAAARSVLAE
jgi:hypothetical protein